MYPLRPGWGMGWLGQTVRSGFFGVCFLLSSCGGGGSSGDPPAEILYVLAEVTSSPHAGSIYYYAMNPGNGSFYPTPPANWPISTGGDVSISLLADPANHNLLFVLNNNNGTTTASGSVSSVTAASYGTLMALVQTIPTGPNPVSMAVDPGRGYLVVADHGSGSSSCSSSNCGDVEAFRISSNGSMSAVGTAWSNSACPDPFRVVFAPNASGSSANTFNVVCTSPELLNSKNPGIAIYACTLSHSCNTGSPAYSSTSGSSALINFSFDSSGSVAVGPGMTGSGGSSSGSLLVCPFSTTSGLSCLTNTLLINNTWLPSGNIAFSGNGTTEQAYVGNHYPNGFGGFMSNSVKFASCSISASSPSCANSYSLSQDGPIYFFVSGSTLFVASTLSPIEGSYTAGSGTTSNLTHPANGFLYACPLSRLNNCLSTSLGGYWPVSVMVDPQTNNYLFLPTLSGIVGVYSGAASGSLVHLQDINVGEPAISALVLQ